MAYWIFTICLFITIVIIGMVIWKKGIKDDDLEPDIFKSLIVLACFCLLFFIPLAIDLPSAICGGQEIYVDELPTVEHWGTHISFIKTDNKELKHLKLADWEMYEKCGNYRIKYTKPIKFVLKIEKLN